MTFKLTEPVNGVRYQDGQPVEFAYDAGTYDPEDQVDIDTLQFLTDHGIGTGETSSRKTPAKRATKAADAASSEE